MTRLLQSSQVLLLANPDKVSGRQTRGMDRQDGGGN